MNILIVSHAVPPHASIGSLRIYKMVKYLKQNNHEVKILTTKKYNFDGKQDNFQDFGDIEIVEVPYAPFKYFNRFKTKTSVKVDNQDINTSTKTNETFLYKMKLQARKLRKVIGSLVDVHDLWVYPAKNMGLALYKDWRYDVVISSFGPPASHMVASKLKRVHKDIFWVADYRDLWSQNFNSPAKFPFSLFEKYLEVSSVKYADCLTTVSEHPKEKLEELFPSKSIEVIYNGYDVFRSSSTKEKDNNKITIVYTGTVYDKQDPSKLFETIDQIQDKQNIEINFYGDINDKCKRLIEKYDFVNFYGRLPRKEILKIQENADVLLMLEWTDSNQQGVLTGKLFEYLELKKPILCVGHYRNASADVLDKVGIGRFCSTNKEIKKFIENFESYTPDKKNLYKYSFEHQIEKMEKVFNEKFQ